MHITSFLISQRITRSDFGLGTKGYVRTSYIVYLTTYPTSVLKVVSIANYNALVAEIDFQLFHSPLEQ